MTPLPHLLPLQDQAWEKGMSCEWGTRKAEGEEE